ncbi:hypothetical protein ACFV7Q_23855 [Streptomyces sp. NPDC059851]|uniref:hypothetical protein n=1 Tax=Streptomyces sp. NPDC059851 TaxID=3346971 RepID=UPI00364D3B67
MLGFTVSVVIPTGEQAEDLKDSSHHHGSDRILASWTTTDVLMWLNDLVQHGKAQEILCSGYPLRYTARAGDVLPLLTDEELLGIGRWPFTDPYLDPDLIAACPPDELLIIDAWDQS